MNVKSTDKFGVCSVLPRICRELSEGLLVNAKQLLTALDDEIKKLTYVRKNMSV